MTLHWSKTNQFGEHLVFSLPVVENSVLCPVTAICNMIALVLARTGLCFRRPGGLPFMYYQFHAKLHSALRLAGYQEQLFSLHLFRRGGSTFIFNCGVPSELIKLLGGWKSDCYLRYLEAYGGLGSGHSAHETSYSTHELVKSIL